ncbi:hypothetical protein DUI87_33556 [Hirundo rustica rustica]|uniref:G-protein coupled receptors family 1 profile domain-containing protein n=1 Tax=Hirundo rustica rustica TaxID=333673 RepID=A0A3M0IN09_HIRRU|nr:hypothetical protein DUI87_33556 [Hirundo rustica rustica]
MKINPRAGAALLWRQRVRAGTVLLGEEKAPGRSLSSFQCLKVLEETWRGVSDKGLERQNRGNGFNLAEGRFRWILEEILCEEGIPGSDSFKAPSLVNKLQLEIGNMNKQHKEAVDIYQKDIESRKVNENKLQEEVEKMKLLYDEATMIQRETDIRCQHKITEMVALMEKHKENLIKEHSRNRSPESEKKHKIDCKVEEAQTYLQSRAQGKSKKCFSNWIVIQTALSTRTFWSPWPATAISNSSSISHFLLLALPDTRQLQLLHFCFFLSIPLAALLGNSLIISTTACGHHLHTPMFFFLLNLALTHLGSICTTVPKAMYSSLWGTRHISYAGCAAQVSIFFCLMSVEYFLLTIMRFDHYVSICKFLHYGTLLGSTACAHMAAAAWASAFLNALMHTANTFSLPLCQGNALGQFFCEIPHILKLSCSKSYLRELGLIAVTASLLFGCFCVHCFLLGADVWGRAEDPL